MVPPDKYFDVNKFYDMLDEFSEYVRSTAPKKGAMQLAAEEKQKLAEKTDRLFNKIAHEKIKNLLIASHFDVVAGMRTRCMWADDWASVLLDYVRDARKEAKNIIASEAWNEKMYGRTDGT